MSICSPGSFATLCNSGLDVPVLDWSEADNKDFQRDLCFQLSLQGGKIGHCDLNKSDYFKLYYIELKYVILEYIML